MIHDIYEINIYIFYIYVKKPTISCINLNIILTSLTHTCNVYIEEEQ